ncbi:TPA: gamma-glutamyl-gamma-aminobutyrate hydrolase family protein [Streptococcus pyogenes]|nr:gamma-glutamyl-gamma-aminobutyrate hydrolase family protein [Streptococcus pyogenes]HER0878376.1 gamma-glutamyl-gamma-aminobutyrate hydrolase family protein [Streptococcus pyogenes]
MTKPIIGITANQRLNMALDNLPWSYAPTGFVQAVTQSGGLPLLLPIGDEAAAKTYVSMVDKIILIGGQNVDPKYYQEEKAAFDDDFSPERDTFEPDSILYPIYGHKTLINSFHRQSLKTVAKDLKVIARDPRDGTIEAVISTNDAIPFLGVQWHPELLQGVRDEDLQLFRLFVNDF